MLASAAADGAVRLWSLEGHYIGECVYTPSHTHAPTHTRPHTGSFGQDQIWTLGDPSSYQHPLSPDDITLEPTPPSFNTETKSLEILLDSTSPDKCDEQEVGVASKDMVGGVSEGCGAVTDVEDVIQVSTLKLLYLSVSIHAQTDDDTLLQTHISLGVPV